MAGQFTVSSDGQAYLGTTLRSFRQAHRLTQQKAGELMGFPASSAQSSYSLRETTAENARYIAPSIAELVRLEDGVGVPRGTILRSAGMVVCPDVDTEPLELVRSWIWLNESEQTVISTLIRAALDRRASATELGPAKRRRKIR